MIYYYLIFCLVCFIIYFIPERNIDIWSIFRETQELIDSINDEKIRNKIANFLDLVISNLAFALLTALIISLIPILNIMVVFDKIKRLRNC